MLGLNLRSEFRNRILKGTAIDFNKEVTKSAEEFLEMTYIGTNRLHQEMQHHSFIITKRKKNIAKGSIFPIRVLRNYGTMMKRVLVN